ncbi:MAG: hypothetical protein AAFP82_06190 [Bacteroidota bacterium]
MRLILLLSSLLIASTVFAQDVESNIFLFDIQKKSERDFAFKNPQYLTDFNPLGYNNQPKFFNSGEIYISVKEPNEEQTEIYQLNLYRKSKSKVTETAESEFSPTLMPDLFNFSAVRVEQNGDQRLWQFPVDRLDNGKPIFKYVTNIGYHHWINSRRVALFLLGEGENQNSLAIADVATDQVTPLVSNIGRCFQTMPSTGNLLFVHKVSPRTWYIKQLNAYDKYAKGEIVAQTLPGSEDFVVLEDGTFLMGNGSKLFKFHPSYDTDKGWREIADFQYYGIRNITRLALSDDGKIAVVTEGSAPKRF